MTKLSNQERLLSSSSHIESPWEFNGPGSRFQPDTCTIGEHNHDNPDVKSTLAKNSGEIIR